MAMANGSHHAFFMSNSLAGDMMDLGTGGGTNSEAYCINSNRSVVGYAMMSNGSMEPIMSTNASYGSSSMMTMGMGGMGGASGGQAWSINNMGDDVGQAQMSGGNYHAFASGGGGMMGRTTVDLGTLGGTNSFAYCINDAGTVIGSAEMVDGAYHAFMVTNALGGMVRMMDLNNMVPTNSGWNLMVARGMNAAGQIVGWGMYAGHTKAFLLTPVSAPVMMTSAPAPQIVGPSASVTMQMEMSASEPLTYQWLHNGMPIPGATNASLTLPGMSLGNAGQYTVTARNAVGTVASSSVVSSMFGMQFTNGSPHLTVAAAVGSHFRIDYSDMLGSSVNWQAMTNFTMMGSVSKMSDAPPSDSRARFYRAVMMP
jgi:probable HAF family extracellular repeat protein